MRARLRGAWRLLTDLAAYSVRTGRWWLPVATLLLGIAGFLVLFVKAAVPTVVYVLF